VESVPEVCHVAKWGGPPSSLVRCGHVRRAVVDKNDLFARRAEVAGHRGEGGRIRLAMAEAVAEEQVVEPGEDIQVSPGQRLLLQRSVVGKKSEYAVATMPVEHVDDGRVRLERTAPRVVEVVIAAGKARAVRICARTCAAEP
jgi:hypothetical protein